MRGQTFVLADITTGSVSLLVAPVPFPVRTGKEVWDWVTLIRRLHRLTRQDKGWASHVRCNPSQQLVSRLIGRIRETGVHGLSVEQVTPETQVLTGVSAQHKIATLRTIVFLSNRPRKHLGGNLIQHTVSVVRHVSTCTPRMRLPGFVLHAYFNSANSGLH